MTSIKIFFYIFFISTALFFLAAAVYIYFMPYPKICEYGCKTAKKYLNGPDCQSVQEKFKDSTIPRPTPIAYMTNFIYIKGVAPYCAPVWYAFKYVRNSNGGYGPLSKWTGTNPLISEEDQIPMPIYSGAKVFPCPPGGCKFAVGNGSCSFNQPSLTLFGTPDVDVKFNSDDGYTLNVHRQVGSGFDKLGNPLGFDPNNEGDIVGSFIVAPSKIFFIDALKNPNTTNMQTCCPWPF
jgi:hypothetical protein